MAAVAAWVILVSPWAQALAKQTAIDYLSVHVYPVDRTSLDNLDRVSTISTRFGKGFQTGALDDKTNFTPDDFRNVVPRFSAEARKANEGISHERQEGVTPDAPRLRRARGHERTPAVESRLLLTSGRYSVVLPSKCSGSASASAFVARTTPSR